MIRKFFKRMLVLILAALFVSLPVNADAQTTKTPEAVYKIIRSNLLAHKDEFTITMSTRTMKEIGINTDLFDKAAAIDDKNTSKDFDYLNLSVGKWSQRWRYSSIGGTATLTATAVYRSSLAQEKKLDTKIKSILENLNIENASDYQKVKAIHNYIINRVSYDTTLQKHTAYNALINKSAVCEGYALAAYRLFTDAGIDCRIITGIGNGDSHAWNIVKVDGQWYNIDLTWDDPITNTGKQILTYDYFLKSTNDFGYHVRDYQYNTRAFLQTYPIAEVSYEHAE